MAERTGGEQFAINADELPNGGKTVVELDDRLLLIFRIEDQFFCLEDVCTHDGGALGEGEHFGYEIACPRHGARFDIRTGEPLCMPATEPTPAYECRVEDGKVYVKLEE